ncbi:MAG TPA: glycosyltransferase family A protein [Blastocatellia bacterium]|nr:glycosyltransferase family A protein [Blastocatellia bacterium]
MKTPGLSVALPVYNGADYLAEALDSALAQTFSDFEIVVSDNCSTDQTPAILDDYARRDRRIRVHRADDFLAQAENVNRAVSLCQGDWVKLLCHDDLMQPRCMETLHGIINANGDDSVGLIGNGEAWLFANGIRYAVEDEAATTQRYDGREMIRQLMNGTASVPLPALTTATVRKRAWEQGPKFESRFIHFDVFCWQRLLMQWNFVYVPRQLTINRIHAAQVAASARRSLRSVEDYRLFYKEFLKGDAVRLELGPAALFKARLKPLSVAASTVMIELLKKRFANALRVIMRLPVWWWPALPVLIARNLKKESPKIEALRHRVPTSLIYPG